MRKFWNLGIENPFKLKLRLKKKFLELVQFDIFMGSILKYEFSEIFPQTQALLDTKQMLDAEIAIYRKMLEGEESRVGLRQMVEQVRGPKIVKISKKNRTLTLNQKTSKHSTNPQP